MDRIARRCTGCERLGRLAGVVVHVTVVCSAGHGAVAQIIATRQKQTVDDCSISFVLADSMASSSGPKFMTDYFH